MDHSKWKCGLIFTQARAGQTRGVLCKRRARGGASFGGGARWSCNDHYCRVILMLFIMLVIVTSWVYFEIKLHFNHNLRLRKQKSAEYPSVTGYWSSCRPSRTTGVASRSDWKSKNWSIPIKCWCSVRATVLSASRWVKIRHKHD